MTAWEKAQSCAPAPSPSREGLQRAPHVRSQRHVKGRGAWTDGYADGEKTRVSREGASEPCLR